MEWSFTGDVQQKVRRFPAGGQHGSTTHEAIAVRALEGSRVTR
jgi:hypothetical protein